MGLWREGTKHATSLGMVGGAFVPLVVKMLGLWTPFALQCLLLIASRTTCGLSPDEATWHLVQQLSIKLWSYNALLYLIAFNMVKNVYSGFPFGLVASCPY